MLEKGGLESKMPIYDSGRMIMKEGHLTLQDKMKCSTRKHLALYGLEEVELQHEGQKLEAAGTLYVSLTKYKAVDPATPIPLSVGTPWGQEKPSCGEQNQRCVGKETKMSLERERA